VLILKVDKVLCFDALLQVLILKEIAGREIDDSRQLKVKRVREESPHLPRQMRGTREDGDDAGSEMRRAKERSFGSLRSLGTRILFGCSVFLEGFGRGEYPHSPAFRMVIKTKGLLKFIVVSD